MLSGNLPPALLAEWLGSFTCYCGNAEVEQVPKKRVSTESWPWRRKFCCSSNQPYNRRPSILPPRYPCSMPFYKFLLPHCHQFFLFYYVLFTVCEFWKDFSVWTLYTFTLSHSTVNPQCVEWLSVNVHPEKSFQNSQTVHKCQNLACCPQYGAEKQHESIQLLFPKFWEPVWLVVRQ